MSTKQEASYDIQDIESYDSNEWEFYRTVTVRINNPHGRDVVGMHTGTARPRGDGITNDPEKLHITTQYWWPDSHEPQGPIAEQIEQFDIRGDIDDDETVLDNLKKTVTVDAQAELEAIAHNAISDIDDELGI